MKKQIAIVIILLLGIVVSVVLSQRQQILKSRASLQAYSAFNVASNEPGKYVKCEGNVCETNTLNITISVADVAALNIQEQQVVAGKTDEQCQQELGEPPPFCDLNTCIKNKPVVKDDQCRFDSERVDVALCPNNCQSNGTQTILCQEYEVCERYQDGKLTGNLKKYWINEAGGLEGCQEQQKISDQNKCPVDQVLASSQYTVAGGGFTGQVSAGSAPIPFCSAQDFATPCWQGADCKEENQVYANKACSNNHGAGSKCTRSTGASNAFEDGCTQPESTAVADSCSGQYITACWQGADCKEENQASANAVCSQNHSPGSVCTRATGMGDVFEDGCTYGRGGQLAAGIKQACTAESFATSCWMEARCDETNQRFADRTCVNNHGEGSICTRATGIPGTSDDGCTKTVVDVAQARRTRAAQSSACTDIEECDEKTGRKKIYPCGQEPAIEIAFDASCIPDLTPEKAGLALDLNLESQRLAKKQEAEKQDKPFWEKAGDLAGGLWNGIISLGKGIQEAPTQDEVSQANAQALKRQIDSLFAEGRRNAEVDQEQLQKLLECQANYRQAIKEGKNPEDLQDCSSAVPQIPQKDIDKKAKEAEVCALESGDVKTCLRKTGVNMDVGEAKIAKTGICLNAFSNPNPFARCIGFTGESVVPADPSQNLSEVLRKAEVLKLAESLGLDLEKDDPKYWEKEKREFFFHAAARTDINAAKYAAEFFGIPITSWENADKAAKICARDHGNLCFVDRFNPASVAGLKDEDVEKIKSIYRGFTPAPLQDVRNYAAYLSFAANDPLAGKRLLGHLSPEELKSVKRTYEVYQNAGEYFKENTTAGRLYSEKQAQAYADTAVGLVFTVVDPMPVAQALSSSLKYVIVKQVWNRLSQRLGPTVARQIVGQAEDAISRGVYTAAQRNAVNIVEGEVVRILDEEGVEISARSTGSSLNFVIQNGTEPPPVIKGLIETRADPRVQQTAANAIPPLHNGLGKLDEAAVAVFPADAHFVDPQAPAGNPVTAVQNGVDNLVDDVGRALRGEAEPPVPAVADVAALPPSNPVLARVADDAVPGDVPLVDVADGLGGVEVRLLGEASTPNPARDIVANGAANAADGVSSVLDDLAGHPCPAGPAGVQCKITANTVPSIGHPERNEDAFSHNAQRGVAGVFDGMGGHKGGEWASSRAQKLLSETIEAIDDTNPQIVEEKMRQALIDASGQISRETDPELLKPGRGYPGTTASVVKVVEHDGQQVAVIGNVGDSRVYRFRNGRLEQLTKDDDVFFSDKISREISEAQRRSDLSEEAKAKWGVRHQISQALGGPNTPDPRMSVVQLKPGDRLILTSDGVHDNLTRTEIEQILKSNPQNPSQELMEKALARSKEPNPDLYDKYGNLYYEYRPKKDDITAVVVDIPSDQASSPLQQGARGIQGAWENLRSAVSPKKVATPVSKEIRDAQSWEDFFRLVDAQGQVVGSDGTVHTASQIKKTALAVKSGNVQPEFLTRSDGVRETVEKLMSAPCPIRLGLVGVVLAQGVGGGLNPCPKGPLAALARNAGNAGKQVLDKVRDVISRESEAGLKIPQGLSENKIHDVEYTHQILRETFPSSRSEVFSTVGSSAIIYTDKNSPGVVYKVYNGYVGLSDDPLVKRISDIRYAEQEAKKLQILSQEGLAPKLVEYVPPNLTDEESRLLRDSSFGFSRPENSAMQAVTLSPAREGGQQPIIVMGKVETDGQGAIKLDRNPARKKAEIDRVVSTLERLEFYPADTELVVDKSGKIIFVDLGGMSSRPTFKGQSVREEVERNFNALLKSQLQQEKPRNILERVGDTVGGTWNGFINGAVDLVTEGTLGWVQKTKPRFNIYQELVGRKGPLVELAGPTDEGFKMVNVYKREDKFYVAQADGIQRGTDKELIVSHLRAEGVSIKLPGCDPYNYGPVSFQADATRVPLRNSSVGAIFVSCLPRDVRQKTIKQSHGALEDGGLLIWQGGVKEDIEVAEKTGFQVVSLVRYEGKFPGGIKSDTYHVIFQKATSGGLEVEQVLGKTPLQTAKDTFSGWVDNVKGIFRREGKEEVKQLSEVETFLAEHRGIISSLKEADTIRTLVEAADVVRAREIIEQTLKTSANNAGTELSEPALFELTEQIIDAHVLGRRVLDYTKRYQPEDLISLSQIADAKPITFSTSRDLPTIFNSPRTFSFTEDQTKEIIQRVEAVSQNIKVPKVGVMKEIANVIGALNAKLADPSTTVGRDQRRLINILYSTSDFPDSFYIRRLNEFFESGGKNSDLPSLLADLLAENKSRYEGFKDYWGPVIDINNLDILPVAQKKYQNYGVKLAPADPEDITWISKKEVDATGRGEAGFCPIHTCIQDSGHQYLGLVLNLDGSERSIALPEGVFYRSEAEFVNATMRVTSGELASERRTRSLAALLHESIHSQVLHQIGLYQAIPDKAMSEIVEELTERLNVSILKEVQSTKHGLLTRYDGEYSRLRSLGSTILDALSIPEDDITRFAINQDPVGYIQFVDSHLRRLDDSQYRSFIEYLYQNLKIGLSQKDLFLSRRINSVMDIRLMNEEWANNLGLIGQLGVRNFQALQKQVMNGVIPLGNREIYIDIDTFSRYIEGNITDKSAYLSSRYYSETIAGQRALSYQRPAEGMVQQGIPVAGPGVVFDSIQPKSFFEQARDTVQNWFNGIFNVGKKQSLSWDLAVV